VSVVIGEENLFIDKVSGKFASRPKLDALLAKLQPKDQIVVNSARSTCL